MKQILTPLILLIILSLLKFSTSQANDDVNLDDKHSAFLTSSNWEEEIAKPGYTLVEFYVPWCSACKSLAPLWAAAAATINTSPSNTNTNTDEDKDTDSIPFRLAKVDCVQNEDLWSKFPLIASYPTILIFYNGVLLEEYNGQRTTEAIEAYSDRASNAPRLIEFGPEAEEFLFLERPGYKNHVLLFNPTSSGLLLMKAASTSFIGSATFVHVPTSRTEIYESLGVALGTDDVVKAVFSRKEDNELSFYTMEEGEDVSDFVRRSLKGGKEGRDGFRTGEDEKAEEL